MKIPIIKSKKFILRPFKKGDEKSLAKNVNNRKINEMVSLIPYPYSLKDAKKWVAFNLNEYKKEKPLNINFVIDINGEVAGSIGLRGIKENHKAEVGYWLAEQYWGGGIMTSALKLITKFGFEELKLKRIQLEAYSFNKASQRVAEKSGYKLEGILRKSVKKGDKFLDACMFAKIK